LIQIVSVTEYSNYFCRNCWYKQHLLYMKQVQSLWL